ncbi:MAG TPA: cytochrome P450 [Baekduia sp.]
MAATTEARVDVNFADPAVNHDIHAHYRRVREAGPVVFNGLMQKHLVAGYAELRKMLVSEAFFETDKEFFDNLFNGRAFQADDNPRHNETRSSWDPHLRRNAVLARHELMQEIATEAIDGLAGRLRAGERVELVHAVALDIPTRLITRLLGIPQDELAVWQGWADDISELSNELTGPRAAVLELQDVAGFQAIRAMCEAGGEQLARRRAMGDTSDLIGLLAHSPVVETLAEDEQRAQIASVFMAGHETTAKFLTNAMNVLARHPEQLEALVADRALIPQAIEELLRYSGVVGPVMRVASEDTELGGVPVAAGSQMVGLPSAANRDPSRWERPDVFDVFRASLPNIAFGFGTHVCIGQHLARANAEIILNRIFDQIPGYRVIETEDELDYGTNWLIRAPVRLHLEL